MEGSRRSVRGARLLHRVGVMTITATVLSMAMTPWS